MSPSILLGKPNNILNASNRIGGCWSNLYPWYTEFNSRNTVACVSAAHFIADTQSPESYEVAVLGCMLHKIWTLVGDKCNAYMARMQSNFKQLTEYDTTSIFKYSFWNTDNSYCPCRVVRKQSPCQLVHLFSPHIPFRCQNRYACPL